MIPGNRFYEANGNDDFRSPWEHTKMPKPDLCARIVLARLLNTRARPESSYRDRGNEIDAIKHGNFCYDTHPRRSTFSENPFFFFNNCDIFHPIVLIILKYF